jgi:hypothetical protein
MRAARAYLVLKTLNELVEITEVRPSFNEVIEEDHFDDTEIRVRFFTGKSLDAVKETVESISEIKEVVLLPLDEIAEEKEAVLRINAGERLDAEMLEERLRNKGKGWAAIDLTDLCELSPAALNLLLWARSLSEVSFVLPRHPWGKSLLELLGFGENASCGGYNYEDI